MTHPTPRTALIIGATGSFGAHAMCALIRRGWTIRALARDPKAAAAKAGAHMPVEWIAGDAMNPEDVVAAARGAGVIVHAANPPRYRNWPRVVLPMMASTIAAAKARGARIVLPGTVYNYAPTAGAAITEDAPQTPVTRKGKIRAEMEAMLRQASTAGAKVLILRAGDFFGPAAPNSALDWLTQRKAGRVTGVYSPGPAPHAFAYLPDLAETLGRLLEREDELADFETFHFAGHWLEKADLTAAARAATGDARIPMKPFPWLAVHAMAPFNTTMRELLEMRYLWEKPIGLDDGKLRAFLGDIPATPLVAGVREALADLDVAPTGEAAAKSWTAQGTTPYIAGHACPHPV
jgi:nucleoside-diphosphate-sugar epimerase